MGLAVLLLLSSPQAALGRGELDKAVSLTVWACETLQVKPDGRRGSFVLPGRQSTFSWGGGISTALSSQGEAFSASCDFSHVHGRLASFNLYRLTPPSGREDEPPLPRNDQAARTLLEKLGYKGFLVPAAGGKWGPAISGIPLLGFDSVPSTVKFRDGRPSAITVVPVFRRPPSRPPVLSQAQALAKAKDLGARRLKRFSSGFSSKVQKAISGDKWVWIVTFAGKGSAGANQTDTFILDAATGQQMTPKAEGLRDTEMRGEGHPWSPKGLKPAKFDRLERLLKKAGRFNTGPGEVTSAFWNHSSGLTATNGLELNLDSSDRLIRLRTAGQKRVLADSNASLALAKTLIKEEKLALPKGSLRWMTDGPAKQGVVRYIQSALGHDFIEPATLTMQFDSQKRLISFDRLQPLPLPRALPKVILSKREAEGRAAQWAASRWTQESAKLWTQAAPKALRIGWVVSIAQKTPVLAWEIELVRRSRRGDMKPRKTVVFFRADDGKYLRAPDARNSTAQVLGSYYNSDGW